jgi:hypothetical protein
MLRTNCSEKGVDSALRLLNSDDTERIIKAVR